MCRPVANGWRGRHPESRGARGGSTRQRGAVSNLLGRLTAVVKTGGNPGQNIAKSHSPARVRASCPRHSRQDAGATQLRFANHKRRPLPAAFPLFMVHGSWLVVGCSLPTELWTSLMPFNYVFVHALGSGPCWKWYCNIRAASAGVRLVPCPSTVRTTSPRQTTSVAERPAIS